MNDFDIVWNLHENQTIYEIGVELRKKGVPITTVCSVNAIFRQGKGLCYSGFPEDWMDKIKAISDIKQPTLEELRAIIFPGNIDHKNT